MNKIIKFLIDKRFRFYVLSSRGVYNKLSDEEFIRRRWALNFNYPLNLKNPKKFNEKLQWLKIHDRKKIYSTMVDKFEVKEYVANLIGKEYIIPTIGVYNKWEDIKFEDLPNQFVIKCTHDSGGVIIVKDKSKLNLNLAKKKINKSLTKNYYYTGREWPYKNVKPRIIIEKYMCNGENTDLKDYKFFTFNGKVKCFKIDFNRFTNHQANYYDRNLKLLEFGEEVCPPDYTKKIDIPDNIESMINLAEFLSSNNPFVRIDFYSINNKIYFGEITFYPASGFGMFIPEEWDERLGEWLQIESI